LFDKKNFILSKDKMPYDLVKSGKGYKVCNMDSGKCFEKKPIPKIRAEKQRRLLEGIRHGTLKKR
jgi:hypothetical protein